MHPWSFFFRSRPFLDRTLCHFLRRRLTVPTLSVADLFPSCDRRIVHISQMPRGSWSTPLADLVMLLKIAVCSEAKSVIEIGSYRGYTTLALAQHLPSDATVVAIDRH